MPRNAADFQRLRHPQPSRGDAQDNGRDRHHAQQVAHAELPRLKRLLRHGMVPGDVDAESIAMTEWEFEGPSVSINPPPVFIDGECKVPSR